MKTVVELLTDELKKAFAECGYDEQYAKDERGICKGRLR